MRTLNQWFDEYAESHQNATNKQLHYVCVPAIYMSIIGILMSIKITYFNLNIPIIENLAFVILIFVVIFYFRISMSMAIKMALFSVICLAINYLLSFYVNLLVFSIIVFVGAWLGQFYGHKVEGKKPSFLKDIQFLMIGPAWVIDSVFR